MPHRSDTSHPYVRRACASGLWLFTLIPTFGQSSVGGAAPADAQQSAYRDSIAQEELKKETDAVQREILKMIKSLEDNGMDAGSIDRLNAISSNLSRMSKEDMQKVIVVLQNASINSNQQSRQQNLVDAFTGQKNLSTQFKDLAAKLSAQLEADQIPSEIRALIVRQSANIRQTSGLTGTAPDKLTKDQGAIHDVVASEQNSIGTAVTSLSSSLTATAGATTPSTAGQMATALLDYMSHSLVLDTTKLATKLTQEGPFSDAVVKQKAVLGYLADLLATALSKQSALEQLSRAKSDLEQVISDQKALNQAAKDKKLDPASLALRQNDINDRAELAKDTIKGLNPDTAQSIDQSQKTMDSIASELQKSSDPAQTTADQENVVKSLEQADKDLEKEVAAIQSKQNETPPEQMADLQKLQDALTQAKQTAPTDPKATAQQLQQLQQDALPQNTEAAQNIADAANKLSNPTPEATDQAQKDIDAAKQELQQQQDALAQDAQDFKSLTDADNALEQAKQNIKSADSDLQGDPSKSLTSAAQQLTDAQNEASQAAQSSSSATPDSAKQAAGQAADSLKNSVNQAVQADRQGAHQSAQQALQQIQSAEASIAQSMGNLKQKSSQRMMALGQQNSNQQNSNQQNPGQLPPPTSRPTPNNGQVLAGGAVPGTPGSALVMGSLSKKDRDALTQFQSQKTPPEYTAQVQQYMKNLANFGNKN